MTCETVDELAAAYALGAVAPDDDAAIGTHLADCDRPHVEARELIGVGAFVGASVEPVAPSAGLRARLMATAAVTPQEHRSVDRAPASRDVAVQPRPAPRPWWQAGWLSAALGAAAVVVILALGAWNVSLNQQVAERDAVFRAVASADAVHQVAGPAGSGLLIEADGEATFVAEDLAMLPGGSLYELWLIGPDGAPVAVGTLTDTDGIATVTLEQQIGPATTFAVTIEEGRVDAPTSDPVLVATLEG
jgi:anti-sigma-K factor RskA